jgi:hypothetical protein
MRTIEIKRTGYQAEVWGDFCRIYALSENQMLAEERVRRVLHDGQAQTFRFAAGGLAVRLPDGVNPETVTVELVGGPK